MLPFYIYYSMFGFQRVADLIWAAADQQPRGFLLGATSGRTTLGGEGLQHQDGTSHLWAATVPNCKAYDPAFAGEMAVIVDHGMREMLVDQKNVFYYVTLMNENYAQPDVPPAAIDDLIRGAYVFRRLAASAKAKHEVTLLGSGAILTEVIKAAEALAAEGIGSTVISVTSWSELARDGIAREASSFFTGLLAATRGPIIAATDYVRLVPESVRAYVPSGRYYATLGTDGFGRSDTRAALREHFKVDAHHIALKARESLTVS
jgi:pyruvate dehydrogenase E1 component